MEIVKIVKIVNKVVENFIRGRWILIDSVKSENYFENYGYKIGGMGCIDSDKANPVYLVGSYCKRRVGIIWIKWGQYEIWIHIRIERIVVVEFYFTNNHKQKRKSKQQTKRKEKNQNQA